MAVIRCYSNADTYVDCRSGSTINVNYGSSWLIDHDTYKRSYIRFDLSQIPAGSVINNSYLVLTPYTTITGGLNWRMDLAANINGWNEYTMTCGNSGTSYTDSFNWNATTTQPANVPFAISSPYITQWVDYWLRGVRPNNGITMMWGLGYLTFYTRECVAQGYSQDFVPYLVVDFTPPNAAPNTPVITTPNWHQFNTPNPTFTWNFSDPDAGDYQTAYWVDLFGSDNATLLSSTGWIGSGVGSHTITGLGDGAYHFRVYVRDKAGVQSPYGVIGFIVDTVAPTGNARTSPIYTNVSTIRVYADNVSDGNGVAYVDAHMLNMAQNAWVYQGKASQSGNTWYFDFPVGNEGNGARLTRFHAVDPAGNQSSGFDAWVYYDTVAPTASSVTGTQVVSVPINGSYRVYAYGVSDSLSGVNRVQFPTWTDYNGQDDLTGDWQTNPVVRGVSAGGGTWYYDVPLSLHNNEEGTYRTDIYAFDNAGNSAMIGNNATIVDRTPPTIGAPSPQQYTNGTTATVYVEGVSDALSGINRVQVYQVRPDGSYYDIGNASSVGGNRYSIDVSGMNIEGNWGFDFRAYDNAGNVANSGAPKTANVMHDTSKPVIGSGDGERYSNQNSGTIRHTISNVSDATSGVVNVTFQFRKSTDNGATWNAWGSVYNGTQNGTSWYYDVPISGDGYYEIAVMAYDRANNASGYLYMHTTVDSVLANDPNPKVIYQQTTATFTWDAFSDPNPSSGRKSTDFYLYEWDGTSMGAVFHMGNDLGNVTTYTQTGLKAGQRYRYTVTYHDKAGNESSYTYKEFITKKQIGTRKIHKADADIMLPIYALDSGVLGSKSYRIACGSGVVGCYELVDPSDPNASSERINTPQGVKALSK
ncbi:GBS Bsp-like repeat-containing protein [Paenibacillus sp. FSL H8-0034]|uniref:GBS Bsp-like repeat-containing protein n=1 Tax=Paenibacillus sp. FSL H8-0034 TaxID=2954671 RepID=UPI0030F5B7A4